MYSGIESQADHRALKVLVIDRRSAVGQGDNKAAIGGVRATHSDPAKILLCTRTLDVVRTWKEEHGDEIGWKPGGCSARPRSRPG